MNKTYPTLKFPPLKEVVFDLRCKNDPSHGEWLDKFCDKHHSVFPEKREIFSQQVAFAAETKTSSLSAPQVIGYRMSEQEKVLLMPKYSGLSIHFVEEYPGWEMAMKKALGYMTDYLALHPEPHLERLAVRCINIIDVKQPMGNISDHFNIELNIHRHLPQNFRDYLVRFSIMDEESSSMALVTHTVDAKRSNNDKVSFFLDIDTSQLFQGESFNPKELNDQFETLRDFKNKIFFSSLTSSSLERYK